MKRVLLSILLMGASLVGASPVDANPVQDLGDSFWTWRADTQPATSDDIPRIVRPSGWVPDWSPSAIRERHARLGALEAQWQALADTPRSITEETDYRLMGSALARVRWELDHVAAWKRQPQFYIAQALVPIFETLLPPPPLEAERVDDVIRLLEHAPVTLRAGEANLVDMRGPFVDVALEQLKLVPGSIEGMVSGLQPHASPSQRKRLQAALVRASTAFEAFGDFLSMNREGLPLETAVGRESYGFFLSQVALYPYTPDELLIMGRQEWARAVLFEELEHNRNRDIPELPIGTSVEVVAARLHADELKVRSFLMAHGLLTVPGWAGHYRARSFPAYLAPMGWLGRTFDLTSPARVGQDATVYLPDPSYELGYFNLSIMRDPRPIIVHEGVPGHFLQLTLSWTHPNPLRRHYYDSGANEGTGFYAEEMMLQAGLFDDSPKTRETIYNFARLRALRVEVDVKLALGEFTIAEAADYLERTVPMDRSTAEEEAVFFAASPGQAISYQIGKMQTTAFLAEARIQKGDAFDLRHFNDYLWRNGNVPIALLKQEYLALSE